MKKIFPLSPLRAAQVAIVVLFLALIRSIAEPIRMQYYSRGPITMAGIWPFLIGGLAAAAGLLLMTLLYFGAKFKLTVVAGLLTLVGLLLIKFLLLGR